MEKFSHSKTMLIEDNEIDTFIAERILKNVGFKGEIIISNSVVTAINLLEELLKQSENIPSLIFLDLVLPLHDGFYFLEKFNDLFINEEFQPEIIILTACFNPDQKAHLLNNDFVTGYFDKPLTNDIVLSLLSSKYQLNFSL